MGIPVLALSTHNYRSVTRQKNQIKTKEQKYKDVLSCCYLFIVLILEDKKYPYHAYPILWSYPWAVDLFRKRRWIPPYGRKYRATPILRYSYPYGFQQLPPTNYFFKMDKI